MVNEFPNPDLIYALCKGSNSGEPFENILSGSTTEIPVDFENYKGFVEGGLVFRIVLEKVGGDATSYAVELRTKSGATLARDKVLSVTGVTTITDTSFDPPKPFINLETDDEKKPLLFVAITPTGGTDVDLEGIIIIEPKKV